MAKESLERIDAESVGNDENALYRMDVMCKTECYDESSEDEEAVPYRKIDSYPLYCSYSEYAYERSAVVDEVRKAVSSEEDLYCVSIYSIPLNTRIDSGEISVAMVFDANGQSVDHRFEDGEIVEYFDQDDKVVRLAVVYDASSSIKDDDNGHGEYKLLTREYGSRLCHVPFCQVSKPSFPVSDSLRNELEELYEAKRAAVERGVLTFEDLIDLL